MRKLILLFIPVILLNGCGIIEPATKRQSKLGHLELQMTQNQAISVLGEPNRVRAAGQRQDGRFVKLWEYEIYGNYTALADAIMCPILVTIPCWVPMGGDVVPYWLQFVDGKLERWGRAGDWQTAQLLDITVRNTSSEHAPSSPTNP